MKQTQIWRAGQNLRNLRFFNVQRRDNRSTMEKGEIYYVAFADKPLYLRETSEKDNNEDRIPESLKKESTVFFPKSTGSSMLVAESINAVKSDTVTEYVKSCQTMVTFLRKVNNKFNVVLGASGFSNNGDHLKRNLFFTMADGSQGDVFEDTEAPKDIKMYRITQQGQSNVFKRALLNDGERNEMKTFEIIRPSDTETGHYLVPPMFRAPDFSPVFHSFERTMAVLQMVSEIEQVAELLDIGKKELPKGFDVGTLQSQIKFPFVVVEGMDASGKTTLTETLERKLQAVRYYTPPPCIQHLRKFFDGLSEIVRRAYYSLGNYIVAVQIAQECKEKSVIMDRFWHSTAAYGIANETTLSDLPAEDHMTYAWPSDLLKPTCVLFLTVTEEVRKQRMNQRNEAMNWEELSLDRDALFRERLCRAYQRMRNPECVKIDATGTKEQVVEMAKTALTEHGINL